MNTTETRALYAKTIQSARITRRTFVKRTATSALVMTLALSAFQAEAAAVNQNGYYYCGVKMTTFPSFAEDVPTPAPGAKKFLSTKSAPKEFRPDANPTVRYRLEGRIDVNPGYVKNPYIKDPWTVGITAVAVLSMWDENLVGGAGFREIATQSSGLQAVSINWWVGENPAVGDKPKHNRAPENYYTPNKGATDNAFVYFQTVLSQGVAGFPIGTLKIEGEALTTDKGIENVIAVFENGEESVETDPIEAKFDFELAWS